MLNAEPESEFGWTAALNWSQPKYQWKVTGQSCLQSGGCVWIESAWGDWSSDGSVIVKRSETEAQPLLETHAHPTFSLRVCFVQAGCWEECVVQEGNKLKHHRRSSHCGRKTVVIVLVQVSSRTAPPRPGPLQSFSRNAFIWIHLQSHFRSNCTAASSHAGAEMAAQT